MFLSVQFLVGLQAFVYVSGLWILGFGVIEAVDSWAIVGSYRCRATFEFTANTWYLSCFRWLSGFDSSGLIKRHRYVSVLRSQAGRTVKRYLICCDIWTHQVLPIPDKVFGGASFTAVQHFSRGSGYSKHSKQLEKAFLYHWPSEIRRSAARRLLQTCFDDRTFHLFLIGDFR